MGEGGNELEVGGIVGGLVIFGRSMASEIIGRCEPVRQANEAVAVAALSEILAVTIKCEEWTSHNVGGVGYLMWVKEQMEQARSWVGDDEGFLPERIESVE